MKILNEKNAPLIIVLFIVLAIVAPYILTRNWGIVSFGKPTDVGSTIGGISGPILNLLGLLLIYYSFRQQFQANKMLEEEKNENRKTRYFEILREYISQFKQSFDKIDIVKVQTSLKLHNDSGADYGDYLQDIGESEQMKYYVENPDLQDPDISYEGYADPAEIDRQYRERDIGGYFNYTSDAKNYWYAIQVANDIITQLENTDKLSEDHQKILANNFIFYYRLNGLNYSEKIYDFAQTGIRVLRYSKNIFQQSEFYKKLLL